MTDLIWSFAPWAVFLTVVRFGGVYWAASIAAIVAIVVLTRALSLKKAHLFDYVGVVYFIGLGVVIGRFASERHRHLGSLRPGGCPRIALCDRVRVGARQPSLHRALCPGASAEGDLE